MALATRDDTVDSAALLRRHKLAINDALANADSVADANAGLMALLPTRMGPGERALTATVSGMLAGSINGVFNLTGLAEIIAPSALAGLGASIQFAVDDPDMLEAAGSFLEGNLGYAGGVLARFATANTMEWLKTFMTAPAK